MNLDIVLLIIIACQKDVEGQMHNTFS